MTEMTRTLTALNALLSRHVWDDENDPETIYIQGHGYTDEQVRAIVREWFEMVDDGHTDGVAVSFWNEIEPFDQADGQKMYATRAVVTSGNRRLVEDTRRADASRSMSTASFDPEVEKPVRELRVGDVLEDGRVVSGNAFGPPTHDPARARNRALRNHPTTGFSS